ncbi:MAG: nuclear transport factor 2 family protein [Sphingomonadales bacterium]|nr:nuclear transport factor 2 family protein [Sphingomonadales bacterium]
MDDLARLVAGEAIRQVKARYFYGLDHKDWDLWRREVWAADGELHVPEHRTEPYRGIDAIIAWVSAATADQVSIHHGHMPMIEFDGADAARVIWAMEDRLYRTREHPLEGGWTELHGMGHYRERYERRPEGWRLVSSQLTRLRVDMRMTR